MGAGLSNSKQMTFYKLKIVKEIDTPYFFRKEKGTNDVWTEVEQLDYVEGYLKKIETGSYVHEGKEKKTFKIHFDDNTSDGRIVVEGNFNNMTRSMFNSMAGATNINLVKLTAKKWGKSDKKYPTVFVELNGQKSQWKYSLDQLPQVEEIKNKKGEVVSRDDDEVTNFFINTVVPEINAKVTSEFEVTEAMGNVYDPKKTATGNANTIDAAPEPDSMDLPF